MLDAAVVTERPESVEDVRLLKAQSRCHGPVGAKNNQGFAAYSDHAAGMGQGLRQDGPQFPCPIVLPGGLVEQRLQPRMAATVVRCEQFINFHVVGILRDVTLYPSEFHVPSKCERGIGPPRGG